MHSIDDQLKYFSVKVNNGSGCLFQPHTTAYTYVLTVKHNLIKKNGKYTAKINRYNLEIGTELIVQSIYIHPDPSIDLALIVIDYIGKSDYHLMYSKHKRNEILIAFGYPNISQNHPIKTNSFRCRCDFTYINDTSFRIVSEHPLFTFNKSTADNVIGFSGCGLFLEEEGVVILKGVFPELNYSDGTFNALLAYQIDCFDEIVDENNLCELTPEFLLNFNNFKDLAFHSIEPHISQVIQGSIDKIIKRNISPNQIVDLFKGSLYVPYTENYRNKLINKSLWKGWLELLTVLSIIAENIDEEVENSVLLKSYLSKVNLLFSIDEEVLSIVIQKLISDEQLKRLLIDDVCIVINSTSEPAKKIYTKRSIQNILPNIAKASQFTRSIMIDDYSKSYSFSCLHLSHFLNEIGVVDQNIENETPININQIKSIIQNIMTKLND